MFRKHQHDITEAHHLNGRIRIAGAPSDPNINVSIAMDTVGCHPSYLMPSQRLLGRKVRLSPDAFLVAEPSILSRGIVRHAAEPCIKPGPHVVGSFASARSS